MCVYCLVVHVEPNTSFCALPRSFQHNYATSVFFIDVVTYKIDMVTESAQTTPISCLLGENPAHIHLQAQSFNLLIWHMYMYILISIINRNDAVFTCTCIPVPTVHTKFHNITNIRTL